MIRFVFFVDVFPGTICLVFATVWKQNLPLCMVFATFWPSILHGVCNTFDTSRTSRPHFAWYVLHVGTSNIHVDFLKVSFRVP